MSFPPAEASTFIISALSFSASPSGRVFALEAGEVIRTCIAGALTVTMCRGVCITITNTVHLGRLTLRPFVSLPRALVTANVYISTESQ